MAKSELLGSWGESVAADYLRKKRYSVLECNYKTRYGEIDVIAKKKNTVVFVEVKMRKSADFAQAREFVDYYKQKRLISSAEYWIAVNDLDMQYRFDVIEIYAPQGIETKSPEIVHWEDAFQ